MSVPSTYSTRRVAIYWPLHGLMVLFLTLLTQLRLDTHKLREMVRHFADSSAMSKILIEPHLADRLNYSHPKIRFQGCRAARHDDHIHIQFH